MASKAVVDAVEARLGTSWASADGNTLPVLGLNSSDQRPADGSAFIEITYPVANEEWLTVGAPGSNTFREEGAFRIIVNEERTRGMARAQGWIDELRALFRGVQLLSGYMQCFSAPPAVINDDNDLGNYFQFSFSVPYTYQITG